MVANNDISHIVVNQKLFPAMIETKKSPTTIAKENQWIQDNDSEAMEVFITKIMHKYPEKVLAYQNGNTNLLGLFMGEIMRETKGKFNPKAINELLKKKLEK